LLLQLANFSWESVLCVLARALPRVMPLEVRAKCFFDLCRELALREKLRQQSSSANVAALLPTAQHFAFLDLVFAEL
jgi:hypothetical protein